MNYCPLNEVKINQTFKMSLLHLHALLPPHHTKSAVKMLKPEMIFQSIVGRTEKKNVELKCEPDRIALINELEDYTTL